jgi:hypothetical protein
VQQGDASGPLAGKQRKARKVAGVGAGGEQARRLQELGDTLDALVHAVAQQDALASGIARRLHGLWLSELESVVEVTPTELRSNARVVLAADVQHGRFILPAHAAGLRMIALRAQSVPADLTRLARVLGELESGLLDPIEFADWLWRGGALGFDVVQTASAAEIGQSMIDLDRPAEELWDERSQQAVAQWNDLAWQAAQSLDATAIAARFRAPIEQLAQRVNAPELALTLADAQAVRAAADDAALWASSELALLAEQPTLASMLPRAHLTFRVLALIEQAPRFDPRFVELLARFETSACEPGDAFDYALLGAAFERKLLAHPIDPAALIVLADRAPPELVSGLLAGLLESSKRNESATQALALLLSHWGAEALFTRIPPNQVPPALGAALLRTALETRTPPAALASALERMQLPTTIAALAACPELLATAGPAIERRMMADPASCGAQLSDFAGSHPDAARIAGRVVLARQGAGFGADTLKAALLAVARAGFGADLVLPLWETRAAASHARLAALAALEAHPELLRRALAPRVGNMLEPPEIRVALEELRWRQP